MSQFHCAICGGTEGAGLCVREMLFGTRESFRYIECTDCGCLQIERVPEDLARHYPANYFAFRKLDRLANSRVRGFIDSRRVRAALGGRSGVGSVANAVFKPLDYVDWLRRTGHDQRARVLDVGCGAGRLLVRMRHGGLRTTIGLDAFIDAEIRHANGVVVHRGDIDTFAASHAGSFDLVMLHHSLEHMPGQQQVMHDVRRLLAAGGHAVIRIPVADSEAFQRYREHWMSLDAPRHLYLHTRRSLARLAADGGMEVQDVVCDSTPAQFIGSELYQRDIPANAPREQRMVFDKAQLRRFAAETERVNRDGVGDCAAFFLRPV